ncbi:winged helix-turn-helix transcriptional regulator [Halobium palmae]|uniref:Winged helix-turn-helix transcriptional regulator n=1 Tax=Halobium palmae TaxID=1776492 RepID=A0ABD5RW97_9EURY
MSDTGRDDAGRYSERVSEQDILKIFDNAEEPFLTATEIADQLPISQSAVNYRLKEMREKGQLDSKKTGSRAVGWWATVAPRLSEEAQKRADAASREGTVSLDELEAEFANEA